MAIVEPIKNMIMSVNIESLVEQGVNVKIEVSAADLKMFGEGIAEPGNHGIQARDREQETPGGDLLQYT